MTSSATSQDQKWQISAQQKAEATKVTPAALASLPGIPWIARLVLRLVSNLPVGTLFIQLPDNRTLLVEGPADGPEGVLRIRDYRFAWHIVTGGALGAAEGYLRGLWDSPNIASFLELFARVKHPNQSELNGLSLIRLMERIGHLLRANTRKGSRRNIHHHYDLGNAFYTRWLDPTMTYSAARFEAPDQRLSDAQMTKYRTLATNMDLQENHSVLEIGSGWGGFAEFAATEIGCKVTGVTISKEQLDFARKRIFEKGLADRVDIRFQDYRDISDKFDRVASIEMFEAVGEEYWPIFFQKVRDCLHPGGKAGLQIITIDESAYDAYRSGVDFIQRYIFPGGMLPSPTILKAQTNQAGLTWENNLDFGLDYAETLARWRSRFLNAWPEIRELGFDERFKRMWEYYLAYCEAGFRAGNIDVTQITLARPRS